MAKGIKKNLYSLIKPFFDINFFFLVITLILESFNKFASWGSYVSAISSLFFFYVVYEAFASNRKVSSI